MTGLSDDREHVVLELPRGETDVVRITRKTYEGRPFTDLRVYFRGQDGEVHPTKKGCSIRDHELADVIHALSRIASKAGSAQQEQRRRQESGRGGPVERHAPESPLTDADLTEIEVAF